MYCYATTTDCYGQIVARFSSKEQRAKWLECQNALAYSDYHKAYFSNSSKDWEATPRKDVDNLIRKAERVTTHTIWEGVWIEKHLKDEDLEAFGEVLNP